MRYQGGKGRITDWIVSHLEKFPGRKIELFHGGLSVTSVWKPEIANDINPYVSCLIRYCRRGWEPPDFISEESYRKYQRRAHEVNNPMVAFAGFCCSFGGKWFGGYARSHVRQREPIKAAKTTLLKRVEAVAATTFHSTDFSAVPLSPGDVVYCDPPYLGTTQSWGVARFDHARFWNWLRNLRDVTVLVSEFTAPSWATEIDCLDSARCLRTSGADRKLEKLFLVQR